MKTLKYQWFNKERGNKHRSMEWFGIVLYSAGFVLFAATAAEFHLRMYEAMLGFFLTGIYAFVMFSIFCQAADAMKINDKLDRIYFRTPANFERYKKRVMRG